MQSIPSNFPRSSTTPISSSFFLRSFSHTSHVSPPYLERPPILLSYPKIFNFYSDLLTPLPGPVRCPPAPWATLILFHNFLESATKTPPSPTPGRDTPCTSSSIHLVRKIS